MTAEMTFILKYILELQNLTQNRGYTGVDDISINFPEGSNDVLLTLIPKCHKCKTMLDSSTQAVIKDTLEDSPTYNHVMGVTYKCEKCHWEPTTYTVMDYSDSLLKVRKICEERGILKINIMTNFPK